MGFLKKLKKVEKPKKEKKVENSSEKETIQKEKTVPQEKTIPQETQPKVETVAKTEPLPQETEKINFGGIGIVGDHVEITKFKALAKYHKAKTGSIGRLLILILREWNEKNKM